MYYVPYCIQVDLCVFYTVDVYAGSIHVLSIVACEKSKQRT